MIENKKLTAVILAAGNSTRFRQNTNKNFKKIMGIPILQYSLEAFDQNEYVDDLLLVVKQGEEECVHEIIKESKITKDITLIKGGSSRQESVYRAITKTNSEFVIIHDGARPLIKQAYISKCAEAMGQYKGVTIGVKSKDTIKITNDKGIVIESTQRKNTWIVQTPQCFDRKNLVSAHEKFMDNESITDDCMLMELCDYPVKMIEGDYTNVKVTTYDDMKLVEGYSSNGS